MRRDRSGVGLYIWLKSLGSAPENYRVEVMGQRKGNRSMVRAVLTPCPRRDGPWGPWGVHDGYLGFCLALEIAYE